MRRRFDRTELRKGRKFNCYRATRRELSSIYRNSGSRRGGSCRRNDYLEQFLAWCFQDEANTSFHPPQRRLLRTRSWVDLSNKNKKKEAEEEAEDYEEYRGDDVERTRFQRTLKNPG